MPWLPEDPPISLQQLLSGHEPAFRSVVISTLVREGFALGAACLHHPYELVAALAPFHRPERAWLDLGQALHEAGRLGVLVDLDPERPRALLETA